ncbi:uncharacterized protein LOC132286715 isoform X1 [Cornus florida]|uniref:uncharacterized protein LOC132286715 isoform X1 n=1 Tax=Cornus florida TaxID=4283 RepID=UPI00289BDFC9|nr:uncharacterized protein LOC132286715 isoform X1 [Cornus florida]
MEDDDDDVSQKVVKWMEMLKKGLGHELEARIFDGVQMDHVEKGLIRCKSVVPKHLSDKDGNWHVGAMATLIDAIGAAAIFSSAPQVKASVLLDISYFSTAKIQEEVEIEAKVVRHKGRLLAAVVVINKKGSTEMVALGKLWMTSSNVQHPPTTSKINPSKL